MNTPRADEPLDFFISYTGCDEAWAEWIAWQLEAENFSVLIEAWDFLPGSDVPDHIDRGMKARHTLAVVSAAYLKSKHCLNEALGAAWNGGDIGQRKLIPLRIEDVRDTGTIGKKAWIDLFDVEEATARERLLKVTLETARPTRPPNFPGATSRPPTKSASAPAFPVDPEQLRWLRRARRDVAQHLRALKAPNAIGEIAQWCDVEVPADGADRERTHLDAIAERLVHQPDRLKKFRRLRRDLLARGYADDVKQIMHIEDLLLPLWLGPVVRRELLKELQTRSITIVPRAATTTGTAETHMAALDGRPVDYVNPHAPPHNLRGQALLKHVAPPPHDLSVESSALMLLRDLHQQLLGLADAPQTEDAYLQLRGATPAPRSVEDDIAYYTKHFLAACETDKDEIGTRYCAVKLPPSGTRERAIFERQLEKLKEWIPDLPILELCEESRFGEQETMVVRHLVIRSQDHPAPQP